MASSKTATKAKKSAVKNLAPNDEAKVKAGRKAGGNQQEYLKVTLEDVLISGY